VTITQPPAGGALTKEQVLEAVAGVQEPAIGRGLVELRMIPAVEIDGSRLVLTVELLSPIAPYRDKIEQELRSIS
jgi:metal-sulfur cluster biosynthetic enzyme